MQGSFKENGRNVLKGSSFAVGSKESSESFMERRGNSSQQQRKLATLENKKPAKAHHQYNISDFYLSDLKAQANTKRTTFGEDADFDFLKQSAWKGSDFLTKFSSMEIVGDQPINSMSANKSHQKFFEMLPNVLKEFYRERREFTRAFDDFDKAIYCLEEVSDRVKCYRFELGSLIERVSSTFRKIVERVLDANLKLFNDSRLKKDRELKENSSIINKLELERKELEEKNKYLRNLYSLQETEYKICKINLDSLQSEVLLLHDLLKKDIMNVINHLSTIEGSNQKGFVREDPSESLVSGISNLGGVINTLEKEHIEKNNLMINMNNLLKAMLKGSKQDVATQVDEGELLWKPEQIITEEEDKLKKPNIIEAETASVNMANRYDKKETEKSNVELLKMKDREFSRGSSQISGDSINLGENWNLPVSFIVFLENISRQKENGRVLPWLYFKKMLFDIYEERLSMSWEVTGSLLNTHIGLDEFVIIYFLRIHKVRRIAEIKLLEFLVSLKYYSKIWARAALFANLANITCYSKTAPVEENFYYTYDIYLQNFFLYAYSRVKADQSAFFDHPEGMSCVYRDRVEDLCRQILIFSNEQGKKKFVSKILKGCRKINEPAKGEDVEVADLDKVLEYAVDEYFETRKRNFKVLAKNFSKAYETDHGLFSIDDIKNIMNEVISVDSPVPGFSYAKEFTIARVYLHSLTSGKNKFDILNKEFLTSCSKFGVDSPFPYIFIKNLGESGEPTHLFIEKSIQISNQKQIEIATNNFKNLKLERNELIKQGSANNIEVPDSGRELEGHTVKSSGSGKLDDYGKGALKLDSNSMLFAQHFTILRELKQYCKQFKESVQNETNQEVNLRHFDNIMNVLEAGCQFLNFPISI